MFPYGPADSGARSSSIPRTLSRLCIIHCDPRGDPGSEQQTHWSSFRRGSRRNRPPVAAMQQRHRRTKLEATIRQTSGQRTRQRPGTSIRTVLWGRGEVVVPGGKRMPGALRMPPSGGPPTWYVYVGLATESSNTNRASLDDRESQPERCGQMPKQNKQGKLAITKLIAGIDVA